MPEYQSRRSQTHRDSTTASNSCRFNGTRSPKMCRPGQRSRQTTPISTLLSPFLHCSFPLFSLLLSFFFGLKVITIPRICEIRSSSLSPLTRCHWVIRWDTVTTGTRRNSCAWLDGETPEPWLRGRFQLDRVLPRFVKQIIEQKASGHAEKYGDRQFRGRPDRDV